MITIQDEPEAWTPRGSKIYFRAISDQVSQPGFKYGVMVKDMATLKEYEFLIDTHPSDQRLYFELNSMLRMMHQETLLDPIFQLNAHNMETSNPQVESQGKGWNYFEVYISEWYLVGDQLTKDPDTERKRTTYIFNGYFQQSFGYKPDVEAGSTEVRLAMNSVTESRFFSDRFVDTHTWQYQATFNFNSQQNPFLGSILIPALESDFGSIAIQTRLTAMKQNAVNSIGVRLAYGDADSFTFTSWGYQGLPAGFITYVGVYPANLNKETSPAPFPRPSDYSDWIYIEVRGFDVNSQACTKRYIIYNSERFGQSDCRHDRVRLAWVNSRGGYDYFNFIKKNEYQNKIERKSFVRNIFTGTPDIFYSNARQKIDRNNFVDRSLSVISDWVQEEEYVFLRSLLASNQVSIIQDDGSSIPVSIEDTQFIERRARDGKLVNLSLTLNIGYDYWT
jgi:hypothetical protein